MDMADLLNIIQTQGDHIRVLNEMISRVNSMVSDLNDRNLALSKRVTELETLQRLTTENLYAINGRINDMDRNNG